MNGTYDNLSIVSLVIYIIFLINPQSTNAEPILALNSLDNVNQDEVLLGKKLFHSTKLSADNSISCASCHKISEGGDDNLPQSIGISGQIGPINSPSVFNSVLDIAQFWDGRAATLEKQIEGPIHNPKEMGNNWEQIIERLSEDQTMINGFNKVYGGNINKKTISSAIVAYESQLLTLNSPFDLFLNGDNDAISLTAKEGYQLFKSMGCISCHQGRNVGGNMYQYFGVMGNYFRDRGDITEADYGRYNVTKRDNDKYKFKVPSLRNVYKTAPYFHDGSVAALEDAVRIMARYQLGRPISDHQASAITEFLKTLTGKIDEKLLP